MNPPEQPQEQQSPRPAGVDRLVKSARFFGPCFFLGILLAFLFPVGWINLRYRSQIYDDPSMVPPAPVAIVFGAGIRPGGIPSDMLADRLDAAVALFKSGKVQRLLMTGDNGSLDYDEVSAMKRWAVNRGVPENRINMDYAGFRTYDSCVRAKQIFGIDNAILVTQGYHLPRALYLASSFGIKAVGLKAGLDSYPGQLYFDLREVAALSMAWYEVIIIHPKPRFLGDPIDLEKQTG